MSSCLPITFPPLRWPAKDPGEDLDYWLDWTADLEAGETITASEWVKPAGITADGEAVVETMTLMWLRDGTAGEEYTFTNTIHTSAGRIYERSVRVAVREK